MPHLFVARLCDSSGKTVLFKDEGCKGFSEGVSKSAFRAIGILVLAHGKNDMGAEVTQFVSGLDVDADPEFVGRMILNPPQTEDGLITPCPIKVVISTKPVLEDMVA